MADCSNKTKALEYLIKLQDITCGPVKELKSEIDILESTLYAKRGWFTEILQNVSDLKYDVDQELEKINKQFSSLELDIYKSLSPDDNFSMIRQFQDENKVSEKIEPMRKRLAEMKKEYKRFEEIEKGRNETYKRMKELVNQVNIASCDLIKEIEHHISGTHSELLTVRSELHNYHSKVRTIANNVSNDLYKTKSAIETCDNMKILAEKFEDFEQNIIFKKNELSTQRLNMQQMLISYSTKKEEIKPVTSDSKIVINQETTTVDRTSVSQETSTNNFISFEDKETAMVLEQKQNGDFSVQVDAHDNSDNITTKTKLNYLLKVCQEHADRLDLNYQSVKAQFSRNHKMHEVKKCSNTFFEQVKTASDCLNSELKKLKEEEEEKSHYDEPKSKDKPVANVHVPPEINNFNQNLQAFQCETINAAINLSKEMENRLNTVDSESIKEKLKNLIQDLVKIRKQWTEYFAKATVKMERFRADDVASQKQIESTFQILEENIQNKLTEINYRYQELFNERSEQFFTKSKLQEKLKNIQSECENSMFLLLEKINSILNFCRRDEDKIAIDRLATEIKSAMKNFDELCRKEKQSIISIDENGTANVFTALQVLSIQMKTKLGKLRVDIETVMISCNLSDGMILAQITKSTSKDLRMQLKDQCGLNMFKLPFQEMHRVDEDHIRKYELGKPRADKEHHQILLVGMTGSGKSLLVNNMVNYIYGVKHDDDFRFKLIVESEEIRERQTGSSSSQAESMTSWVTSYTFHWQEGFRIPYSLTVIDTPGFGDTRGQQFDDEIFSQIKKLFDNERICSKQELSSIGFLIQASQARVTAEQKYIVDQVLKLFGKDMEKNISMIFTFADAQPPPALETIQANNISFADYFKFNNSALYAPNTDRLSKFSWDFGYSNLKKYFDALEIKIPVSLVLTKKVMDEQEHLQLTLGALQNEISNGMENLALLESQSKIIESLTGTISSKRNFKVKSQSFRCDRRVVEYSITNCNFCTTTCHEPCHIVGDIKDKCAVLLTGSCTVCREKCPAYWHSNGNTVYTYTLEENEVTLEAMMREYNVAVTEKNAKDRLMIGLYENYKKNKVEILRCIKKASECCNRLEEISLRTSNITNVTFIDRLIQSESRSSRLNKEKRLAQLYHLRHVAEILSSLGGSCEMSALPVSTFERNMLIVLNRNGCYPSGQTLV